MEALVIAAHRRYTADEKAHILTTIAQGSGTVPRAESRRAILDDLGLPNATHHRWRERALHAQLTDQIVVPQREALGSFWTEN